MNQYLRLLFLAFLFPCCASFLSGQHRLVASEFVSAFPESLFHHPDEVKQLRLDFAALASLVEDQVEVALELAGTSLVFSLRRQELRAPNFQRTFGSGRLDDTRRPSAQFSGHLTGAPKNRAFFTFDDDFLLGHWEQGQKAWTLAPLWLTDASAPRDVYLLYEAANVHLPGATCGVMVSEDRYFSKTRTRGWIGSQELDLGVAVDNLMYQRFPDSASLENFVLGLLARVQADYDRGFDGRLCFLLSELYMSDGSNEEPWSPTSNAEVLTFSFRDWANSGHWAANFDMAALWTGRDLLLQGDDNNIGWAYIDAVCSDRRYHVVEYWSQVPDALRAIWSHEIGHNLGALHVNRANLIMNPTVEARNREWSTVTRETIRNNLSNYNCLETSPWLLFTAVAEGQTAILNWSFTWHETNQGFYVERAEENDGAYVSIDWVPGSENPEQRLYNYRDENLVPGKIYYYRLRQLSDDGSGYVTPEARVVITYPEGIRVAPNPTTDVIRVVSDYDLKSDYRITDMAGREVRSGRITLGATEISLVGLAAGVYFYYELWETGARFVTKILKH